MAQAATRAVELRSLVAVVATLCGCAVQVRAQVDQGTSTQATAAQIAISGQMELARLLDLAAERLKLNIEYDPQAVKGTVTLRITGNVSDDELWPLVNRVLASRGFTTVRLPRKAGQDDNAYTVVKLTDAPGMARIEGSTPLAGTPTGAGEFAGGFQTVVIRAKHRPAKELVDAVNRVATRGSGSGGAAGGPAMEIGGSASASVAGTAGSGGAAGPSALGGGGTGGLILLSDLATRIEQALRLLEILDVPGAGTSIEEIPVRHLSAVSLAALVTQVSAKRESVSGEKISGEILASPTGVSVFLVSPSERREHWKALIAQLDQREAVLTETYTPEHFAPREVGKLIEQTIRDTPGSGAGAGSGTGNAGGGDDRWRMVIDELTASLVITATPSQHERVRSLLDRLASVPAAARRPVRLFKIKNRPVREMTAILSELMRAGVIDAGAQDLRSTGKDSVAQPKTAIGTDSAPSSSIPLNIPNVNPPSQSPAATSPLIQGKPGSGTVSSSRGGSNTSRDSGREPEPDLVLTADEGTNTLIAVGEPRMLSQLEQLIKTLDIRQPQVMLEVVLLSLTDSQAISLGVELARALDLGGDTKASLFSLFGLSSSGTGGGIDRLVADAAGFTGLVLNPGDFAAVIRALETLNDGRSISRPRLLVNNNQQAVFSSVLQQPVATISTSTSSTISGFSGTQDAGTTASIKPAIAEGDHLALEYEVKLSSFSGTPPAQGLPPPRQENRVQSTVTIPDNFTVVVGGLDVMTDTKATTQIPFLGSIPVLGEAFKSRNNSTSRTRFYVFIHATVLRQGGFEDLKYLSDLDVAAAQIDDGWPVVRPRVIK